MMYAYSTTVPTCVLVVVIGVLTGCERLRFEPTAEVLFVQASSAATAHDFTTAIDLLERSFAVGLERPSRAMWDPALESLRRHPASRARLHELLDKHARESVVRITTAAEPGDPLTLRVTIIDEVTGKPVPEARFYVVHTDRAGRYLADSEVWNPRLFGFAVADERGRVEFRTIRPGYYPPEFGTEEPSHVHYHAEHERYRPFDSEIWFDNDPRATPEAMAETGRYGAQIARTARTPYGWLANVTIELQPLADGEARPCT